MSRNAPIIVKVGGSLYDLPDLGNKLRGWLDRQGTSNIVLVPGGGASADVIRDLDRIHSLGEEKAHWLALRSLTLNAYFLADIVPGSRVVETLSESIAANEAGFVAIVDAHRFAIEDEARPGHLPHKWAVTSDSIAARIAVCWHLRSVILLKSVSIPQNMSWAEAGQGGYVDSHFAEVIRSAGQGMQVRAIDLRLNLESLANEQRIIQ